MPVTKHATNMKIVRASKVDVKMVLRLCWDMCIENGMRLLKERAEILRAFNATNRDQ